MNKIIIPDESKKIIEKVSTTGFEIYIVGGAVRDVLMGKNVVDWDYTTNAKPDEITNMFPDSFYDNVFGTVGIPSENGLKAHEITTFRTERDYKDSRHPEKIEWGKTLDEDLQRRDFTINSMAIKLKQNNETEIIDLYGGQKDINHKIIKAVGDAHTRFQEDALRMMRAIRIASQLGFEIEKNTKIALKDCAPLITKIAYERIRDELLKILSSQFAAEGILLLREVGILEIIMPEMEKTFGVEQKSPNRHHIYDVGTHLVMSLKNCESNDPIVRFATLIHDIGKPSVFKKLDSGVITFYNHEIVSAKITSKLAQRFRLSKKDGDKLWRLVRYHQFTVDENQTDSAIRRFIRNVGKDLIEDMITLRVADRLGGGAHATSWRLEEFRKRIIEVQKEPFSIKDLKINGSDVMNILNLKPGPVVGEILNNLYKEVIDKKIQNTNEDLTKKLKENFN